MRIEIFNWAADRKAKDAITTLGYEHRDIVDGEVMELAKKFLDLKVNVMILNVEPGHAADYVLAVDSRTFGQR